MLSEKETLDGIQSFHEKYEEIALYFLKDHGDKIYIGENEDFCRFCVRENQTFEKEAHAISRFFGNDQLILLNECDECNAEFGKTLEPHIDAFTKPFRTISYISGRSGIVKTVDKKQKSSLVVKDGIQKIIDPADSEFCKIDIEKKEITYSFDIGSHIPSAVYKSLIKYALSCLPHNDLKDHLQLLIWVGDKNNYSPIFKPLFAMTTFIAGSVPLQGNVVAGIYNRKEEISDKYINKYFLFGFGNFLYQIPLFTDEEIQRMQNGTINIKMSRFIPPYAIKDAYNLSEYTQYGTEDFSDDTVLKNKVSKLVCGAEEIKPVALDKIEEIHKNGRLVDVNLKDDDSEE